MYVIRMMEDALDRCNAPCGTIEGHEGGRASSERGRCDNSAVNPWDQAVAFYAGSLESESGFGEGLLLYDLADKMCRLFRTCGDDATLDVGTSYVNNEVMREFTLGQANLMKRQCKEAKLSKERIAKLMAVPLIQATLHMAYRQQFYLSDTGEDVAIDQIKGATYAATVLPIVHDCNHRDASNLYDNLRLKNGDATNNVVDFQAVKYAFERTYHCMGVTCNAIGGIWGGTEYAPFAKPCRDIDSGSKAGTFLLVMLGLLFVFSMTLVVLFKSRTGQDKKFEEGDSASVSDVIQASQERTSVIPTIAREFD
jgi:hypothetical protein